MSAAPVSAARGAGPHAREGPLGLCDVLEEEAEALRPTPPGATPAAEPPRDDEARTRAAQRRLHADHHAALCLSGGGIRSATFALGVVQALAAAGLLGRFSYLSTVSGGGYLGSWLNAWMRRSSPKKVEEALARPPRSTLAPEAEEVAHLRAYSNYLAPRAGLLSADTWTLVATYLRNLLLIWLILLPFITAALLVPRIWMAGLRATVARCEGDVVVLAKVVSCEGDVVPAITVLGIGVAELFTILGVALGVLAIAYTHTYLPATGRGAAAGQGSARAPGRGQGSFLLLCLLPLVLATVLLTTAWWWASSVGGFTEGGVADRVADWAERLVAPETTPTPRWVREWVRPSAVFMVLGAVIHGGGWLLGGLYNRFRARHQPGRARALPQQVGAALLQLLGVVISGAAAGALAGLVARGLASLPEEVAGPRLTVTEVQWYVCLALPSFLALLFVGGSLYVGMRSRAADDGAREWASRFNAWLLIVTVLWLVIGVLVIVGPSVVMALGGAMGASVVSLLSGALSAWLGRSAETPANAKEQGADEGKGGTRRGGQGVRRIALALAAPLFVLSLVVVLALAGAALVAGVRGGGDDEGFLLAAAGAPVWLVLAVAVGLVLTGVLVAWLVNSNRFSLHAMYRARLIRAYLGASRPADTRHPDPFTGFDERDNLPMHVLWDYPTADGARPPLHVLNLTLNLVKGDNLAWQERKAESFTVSPLHAGSFHIAPAGYRRTRRRADDAATRLYGGEDGITLGTAMTISGAAASPNMGYHSSPAVTFLMTLFNARLGWWLGNPGSRGSRTFHLPDPRVAIRPIFAELFGLTSDRNRYVYLSDGGHFENLGLYEMVLRRCRPIVVIDASSDERCAFTDLGNAIRKIRVDLGVPITFPADDFAFPKENEFPIYSRASGDKGQYWAVGRIGYSEVDCPDAMPADRLAYDGRLVYVKPAMYGSEPRDVCEYAAASLAFPHESTVDQFFGEAQFESYRALGRHVMAQVVAEVRLGALLPPPRPR